MENVPLSILHLDTVKEWRGGQQQLSYLLQGLHQQGIRTGLVCQPASKLAEYCRERSLPFTTMILRGEFDLPTARRVAEFMNKENFKILHTHSAHAAALGIWVKFFNRRVKHVTTRRVDFSVKKPMIGSLKYNNPFIDKIVCISNEIENVLKNDGVSPQKLLTIHSGIDTHKFDKVKVNQQLKTESGLSPDHFIVGTVAALAGHKDYPNLLQAARQVIDETEKVTFVALGDGPDKEEIFKLAHELKLGERFIFAGFRKNVGEFLKMFDLFVLASKKEGMGTALLDAQAAGLPIVATRAGGIPEVVAEGLNGLLVEKENSAELACAIMKVVKDKDLREKFKHAATEHVRNFDIKQTVSRNIDLYKSLSV